MLSLWSLVALAGPPTPLTPADAPAFPELPGKVKERCVLTWISQEDGQHRELSLEGCEGPFEAAVRNRLWSWTWRTVPPEKPGILDDSWALLTGISGAPGGLLVSWEIRFDRRHPEDEPTVTMVGLPVVKVRKTTRKFAMPELCDLLLHVDEEGRANRVQARSCSEDRRATVESDLMAWTFQPLIVDGAPHRFAVGLAP